MNESWLTITFYWLVIRWPYIPSKAKFEHFRRVTRQRVFYTACVVKTGLCYCVLRVLDVGRTTAPPCLVVALIRPSRDLTVMAVWKRQFYCVWESDIGWESIAQTLEKLQRFSAHSVILAPSVVLRIWLVLTTIIYQWFFLVSSFYWVLKPTYGAARLERDREDANRNAGKMKLKKSPEKHGYE